MHTRYIWSKWTLGLDLGPTLMAYHYGYANIPNPRGTWQEKIRKHKHYTTVDLSVLKCLRWRAWLFSSLKALRSKTKGKHIRSRCDKMFLAVSWWWVCERVIKFFQLSHCFRLFHNKILEKYWKDRNKTHTHTLWIILNSTKWLTFKRPGSRDGSTVNIICCFCRGPQSLVPCPHWPGISAEL